MSAEEAVTAWLASGVPMSLHETTRHREGARRRVVLGGRGRLTGVRAMAWRLVAGKKIHQDTPAVRRHPNPTPCLRRQWVRRHDDGTQVD